MKNIKKYKVRCLECEQDLGNAIIIDDQRISYAESTGILSARKRPDGHWGFECMHCGHYALVAPEEVEDVIKASPVNVQTRIMLRGTVAKRSKRIVRTAKHLEVDGFTMEEIKNR